MPAIEVMGLGLGVYAELRAAHHEINQRSYSLSASIGLRWTAKKSDLVRMAETDLFSTGALNSPRDYFGILHLNTDIIGDSRACVALNESFDMLSLVLYGSGKDEIMMPFSKLSKDKEEAIDPLFPNCDDGFIAASKDLAHINMSIRKFKLIKPRLPKQKIRTVFVCTGKTEWLPGQQVADIARLLNVLFRDVVPGNSIRLVTYGEFDAETIRVCMVEEIRRSADPSATHIPEVRMEEVYLGVSWVPSVCVFDVNVRQAATQTEAKCMEALLPYNLVLQMWKSCEESCKNIYESLENETYDEEEGVENTLLSSSPHVSISVADLPRHYPWALHVLLYVAKRVSSHVTISVGDLRRDYPGAPLHFLFNVAKRVSLRMATDFEESYEALSPAQKEVIFYLFKDELKKLLKTNDDSLVEGIFGGLAEPQRASKPSSLLLADCHKREYYFSIFCDHRIEWFRTRLWLSFSANGLKDRRVPVALLISLMIGLGLTLAYVIIRARAASPEDLIQTALAILTLYVSTVVFVVYRVFHSGETLSDVVSFKHLIDTPSKWNGLSEEERAVVLVQLLIWCPRGRSFIRNTNASFVRDASEEGAFTLFEPTPLANLLVARFEILEKDGKLRLRAADGALADMVEVKPGSNLFEANWLSPTQTANELDDDRDWIQIQQSRKMYIQ